MCENFTFKDRYDFDDLVAIMRILRAPGGCVWDAAQTHDSIRQDFLEETYEALEAIDEKNPDHLKEELGDVLLQVVFHSAIEEEQGNFNVGDVCDGICKKLIVRHPHVFGDAVVKDADEVLDNWEKIKQDQNGQVTATETLKSVPTTFPALMRAQKIGKRAARAGMDYDDISGAVKDLKSELSELEEAISQGSCPQAFSELGDLLFSAVNVARFLGADAEKALTSSCEKFIARFAGVERLASLI